MTASPNAYFASTPGYSKRISEEVAGRKLRETHGHNPLVFVSRVMVAVLVLCAMGWSAIGIDANVSKDAAFASKTLVTPAFSTTSANELLLAFVSTDYLGGASTSVTQMSGAGLTWVLVRRTNVQSGTSEIWRAFASAPLTNVTVTATLSQKVFASMTVLSFSGVDATGTSGSGAIGATGSANATSGAPSATLTTTRNGSWVFGVGNDFDNPIGRTVGTGQSLVHQALPSIGDTYWVQKQNAPTLLSGTAVTINDTAPTGDHYNLTIVEVLPDLGGGGATFSVSGTISPAASGSGATVTLSQSGTTVGTTTADASGNFTFNNLGNNTYTVTPSKQFFTFSPTSQPVTVNAANVSGVAFTATAQTWSISGTISPAASGISVGLSGAATATTTTNASGVYTFSGLANGAYTVTPSQAGTNFSPASINVNVNNANVSGQNFTATAQTWSISGTISPAAAGISVGLSGASAATTTTNASGVYTFSSLANGSYVVTPSQAGTTFSPTSANVTVNGANVTGQNFTITAQTYSISGAISPAAAGIAVNLSGAATANTTTNASGAYTFGGLSSGSYTITPSQAGTTFTPPSLTVSVTNANLTGQNFTATLPTYSVSGSVSPGQSGINVVLSGAASGSTTTDALGNYSFPSLVNGNYTITPSQVNLTFTPTSSPVTVNGANVTGINFTSQTASTPPLSIDARAFGDRGTSSTTVATSAFTTTAGNELLLAFISSDATGPNITVTQIAGGGLTWTLVRRTNVQLGTAEIWRAFAAAPLSNVAVTATLSQSVQSSITVVSFVGVDTSGTNGSGAIGATASANATAGAPTAALTTTRAGSWVFGVANDYDRAIARTLGTGQTLVHQYLAPAGDTYWVQSQTGPTPTLGTAVTINDTAPTGDRFNLTLVEVVPPGESVLPTPPVVNMIAPTPNSTVAFKATVAANATDATGITGVQFLLDGNNLGAEVTSAPYSVTWDLTGLTGNHVLSAIARNTGGLSSTANPITVTVDNSGNPALVGSWTGPVATPAVAVNLMLLPNGKLFFYSDGATPTVWDYTANVFTNIVANPNLFCSGHAALADGRILIVGGYGGSGTNIGIANAEIFNPQNNTFTAVPNMNYKRWYPTATTLSDGRILVTAGWQTTAHSNAGIPEIYDPATNAWTSLTTANNPFETYPFIHLLPDGRLVHVNGSEYATPTDILSLTTNTWSTVDGRTVDGGSSVMYLPNKIVKAGSAADSQFVGPSSKTTFVIDMSQPSPAWQQTPSMAYPRSFLNLVTLPDGNVVVVGGETDKDGGNIANAVYAAEMWNSQTQTWSTMASMKTPREYHATALLLPDGRVVVSGSGADFGAVPDQLSAEFFSPPYLFQGARPTITQAPSTLNYGAGFAITTPDAANISSVVLIRLGMVTHFFDQNTKFVPLSFTQGAGSLSVAMPSNPNLLPPGYYMLFIVNSSGVPAIAPIVKVGP